MAVPGHRRCAESATLLPPLPLICRCGPLLSFKTSVSISEAATDHLMQLQNLSHWTTAQTPRMLPTSIFPSLESLHLNEQEALPWIHLNVSRERSILGNSSASAIAHSTNRETLKSLKFPSTFVDSTPLSPIVKFRNLVALGIGINCPNGCTFRLTDYHVENLTATLPRSKYLKLGLPCPSNSCDTTAVSLLSISDLWTSHSWRSTSTPE